MTDTEQNDFEKRWRLKIEAYHEVALLYAVVKLGLADMLAAGPATAEQLAAALGVSAPHLHRLLRGLSTIGVCQELGDGTFALTPSGGSLVGGPLSDVAEKVEVVVGQYWQPWANLIHSVKTGEPAFDLVFGMSVIDLRRDNPEQGALFDSYLAKDALAQADDLIAALDFSEVKTVAEIGGGYGGLLAAVLQAHPCLHGILFDRPHIVAAAKSFWRSQGLADRIQLIAGDFVAAIPIEADLYLLNGVLRQWDDETAHTILRDCRAAMPDGARLVIIEQLLPERASDDPAAVMLDLHMMTITGGRTRSPSEFKALLAEAGLTLSNITTSSSGLAILEAVPS
jgi:hypothetical protein